MSKYTTELRYICETLAGLQTSKGYNDTKTIIDVSRQEIFDFEYPIYDQSYKSVLENKIIRHYYTREICEETYGLWKLRLEARMNEIMPYYNQLYRSALLEFNPLYDVDLTTKHEGSGTDTQENNVETRGNGSVEQTNNDKENINENGVVTGDKNFENSGTNENSNTHGGNVTDKNTRSEEGINTDTKTGTVNEQNNGEVKNEYEGETNETGTNNTHDKGTTGTSRTEDTTGTNWTLFSDTPQGGIDGINGTEIENDEETDEFKYLTTATKVTSTTNDHEIGSSSTENTGEANQINIGNESFTNTETNDNTRNVENNEEGTSVSNLSSEENNVRSYDETITDTGSNTNKGNEDYNEIKTNEIGRESSGEHNTQNEYNETKVGTVNSLTTDEYLQRVSGKSGGISYSRMLLEYRETFINIDEMIIEELHDLFFGLW